MSDLSFGEALQSLREGKRVSRSGWNGKNMFLVYIADEDYQLNTIAEQKLVGYRQLPWIGMKTADNCFVPWLASQTDVLAHDWGVVE